MKNILVFLLFIASSRAFAQPKYAVISQQMIGIRKAFNLPLNIDQTTATKETYHIIKTLIEKPLHLYAVNLIMKKGNLVPIQKGFNLLVFPGDTVIIKSDSIIYSTGFKQTLDSIFNLKWEDYHFHKLKVKTNLKYDINNIEAEYELNNKRINSLSITSPARLTALKSFIFLLKAKKITEISYQNLSDNDSLILDSCYNDIKENLLTKSVISSILCDVIYDRVFRYSFFKETARLDYNFIEFAFDVDRTIKGSNFYLEYILPRIANMDIKQLGYVIDKTEKDVGIIDNADTIKRVASILLLSKHDFNKAKEDLAKLSSGKFNFLLNHSTTEVQNLTLSDSVGKALLIDYEGKQKSLKDIISQNEAKITVLDFWASWCTPCILEYPDLLKVKKNNNNKSIQFISISIDKEADINKWKNVSFKINNGKTVDQYIVPTTSIKVLNNFFKVRTIPRYIVVNNKGELLDLNFLRPTDPHFLKDLEGLLLK